VQRRRVSARSSTSPATRAIMRTYGSRSGGRRGAGHLDLPAARPRRILAHAPTLRRGALPASPPAVAAVVPARNEALLVARAIGSLVRQRYPGDFHIVLVDDDSSDGHGRRRPPRRSRRASLCAAGQPRAAWLDRQTVGGFGRPSRRPAFRSASTCSSPTRYRASAENLSALVARAASGGYDMVSFMATLECRTFAERALIPAFVFFFFMLYPPAWIGGLRHRTAAAAGGCILIRTEMLDRLGGLAAIRGEVIDDCALPAPSGATADASGWA